MDSPLVVGGLRGESDPSVTTRGAKPSLQSARDPAGVARGKLILLPHPTLILNVTNAPISKISLISFIKGCLFEVLPRGEADYSSSSNSPQCNQCQFPCVQLWHLKCHMMIDKVERQQKMN